MTRDELLKKIESIKKEIELEKSFNPYSGEISFLEYQLSELQKELEKFEKKSNNDII